MEDAIYQQLYDLEDGHWWFRGRRAVLWALIHRAGLPQRGGRVRILDAGCGTGRNLAEFRALGTARGVDPSPAAIEFCRRRGLSEVTAAGIESLPFGAEEFDLILATDVLEHVARDDLAVAELRRVAAPGAMLVVTVPAYRWLWSQHDDSHHHLRRYTAGPLRERLAGAGWRPVLLTYFNSFLLPPIALVRVLARRRSRGRSDYQLTAGALNRALELPMRWEAALIERGVRFPAGVSIGMVCRPA